MKKVFGYLEPLWTGEDGKISLRACVAIVLTWKLVENLDFVIQRWEQGKSFGDANSIFFTLAGLIAALLGITAWSNMTAKKIDVESTIIHEPNITVQQAGTVTTGAKTTAETVNAEKVETVNTNTTNVNTTKEYVPPDGEA